MIGISVALGWFQLMIQCLLWISFCGVWIQIRNLNTPSSINDKFFPCYIHSLKKKKDYEFKTTSSNNAIYSHSFKERDCVTLCDVALFQLAYSIVIISWVQDIKSSMQVSRNTSIGGNICVIYNKKNVLIHVTSKVQNWIIIFHYVQPRFMPSIIMENYQLQTYVHNKWSKFTSSRIQKT